MADPIALARTPLAHLAATLGATADDATHLSEVGLLSMVSVRVDPDGDAARDLAGVLGCPLPTTCGQTSSHQETTVLWLGPDEWLVVSGDHDPAALTAGLHEALAGRPGSVVDVSSNRTTLELSGPHASAVLDKGCPVDLHPRASTPGRAVTTTVGPVPVLLWQTGADTYRLLPRSSFADYLARWLLDAMAEYAGPAPTPSPAPPSVQATSP